jgi:SPX domain protein involved in polyphosphate accumulation
LEDNIGQLENEAEGYAKQGKLDPRIKTRINKELDDIIEKIKELEKFSRINFTGFMKVNYPIDGWANYRLPRSMINCIILEEINLY